MVEHCLRAAALALLPVLAAERASLAQDYGETIDVDVVTIDVEVRDAQGALVTNLERGDFQVKEDGHPVKVTNFERVVRPSTVSEATAAALATPPAAAAEGATAPPEPGGRWIVYVDNMHLHAASRARALSQVRDVLARGLLPGEQVLVASQDLSGLTVRLPFSSDPAAVAAAIDAVEKLAAHAQEDDHTRTTAVQALIALQQDNIRQGDPCATNLTVPVRAAAESLRADVRRTLGRIGFLVNSLAGLPGRKALLYVSDGIPLQPAQELFQVLEDMCSVGQAGAAAYLPPDLVGFDMQELPAVTNAGRSAMLDAASYDMTTDMRKLASHASANRVSLYTLQAIGLSDPGGADASIGGDERILQEPTVAMSMRENPKQALVYLAQQTGGRAIIDTNDFSREVARMREDLAVFYSLGYAPQHQGDGKEHQVEVQVKRPGARLAYRRVYRDKPALEQTADRVLASLIHGYEENPLDVKIELVPAKPLANGHSMVTARLIVPLFKLSTITHDDFYEGKLRVLVATREPGQETAGMRQMEVPIRVPHLQALTAFGQNYVYEVGLELAPGEHPMAFAIRDELAGTASFLRRTVSVPAATPSPAAEPTSH